MRLISSWRAARWTTIRFLIGCRETAAAGTQPRPPLGRPGRLSSNQRPPFAPVATRRASTICRRKSWRNSANLRRTRLFGSGLARTATSRLMSSPAAGSSTGLGSTAAAGPADPEASAQPTRASSRAARGEAISARDGGGGRSGHDPGVLGRRFLAAELASRRQPDDADAAKAELEAHRAVPRRRQRPGGAEALEMDLCALHRAAVQGDLSDQRHLDADDERSVLDDEAVAGRIRLRAPSDASYAVDDETDRVLAAPQPHDALAVAGTANRRLDHRLGGAALLWRKRSWRAWCRWRCFAGCFGRGLVLCGLHNEVPAGVRVDRAAALRAVQVRELLPVELEPE